MTARYISAEIKADWSIHLSNVDSRHTRPAAGDLIIGDYWHRDEPAKLEPCDDWWKAHFRYRAIADWTESPQVATNVQITGSVAWPNLNHPHGFWLRCKISHPEDGDGQPAQEYPGWILCIGRDD